MKMHQVQVPMAENLFLIEQTTSGEMAIKRAGLFIHYTNPFARDFHEITQFIVYH